MTTYKQLHRWRPQQPTTSIFPRCSTSSLETHDHVLQCTTAHDKHALHWNLVQHQLQQTLKTPLIIITALVLGLTSWRTSCPILSPFPMPSLTDALAVSVYTYLHPINPDWPESGFLWTSLPTVCLSWQLYNSQRSPSSPSSTECWSQPSIIRSLRTYSANQWKDRNAFIHDGSTLHAARTSKEAQRSHSCHNTRLQQTGLSSFRRAGTCLWSSPLPLHYSPSIHTGGLARHVESRANSFERPNNPLLQTSTGHYHPISSPAHPTSRTH